MKANENNMRRFVNIFHNPFTAWVILCIGLALTFAAWYTSNNLVEKNGRQRFENRVEDIKNAIRSRMIVYEQVLWGGVGLFEANGQVSRDQFARYVEALSLDQHWPGVQGIGYSVPVLPEDKDQHIQDIQAMGFPSYSIKPDGVRDQYSAIIYLEPFDWRNKRAFGFDMWSNDMRREAMTRARDTGLASTSGLITLVQETEEDVQRGFLTYLPHYRTDMPTTTVEERRAAFQGWVYAPFRMGDLMKGVLGSEMDDVEYEIFDGHTTTEDHLLYDTFGAYHNPADLNRDWTVESALELHGRTWTLVFTPGKDAIFTSERNQPLAVAFAGLIVDILLFYVITSIAYLQKRAESIAADMTTEIRDAHAKLEDKVVESELLVEALQKTNDELSQFAFIASHDLREPLRKITTFGKMLRQEISDDLTERGETFLGFIENSATRMDTLLSSLLAYSRVSSREMHTQMLDLNKILSEVLSDLELTVEETRAELDSDPLPTIEGDPAQMRQLFQNLIANALKYRRQDVQPLIRITSEVKNNEILLTFSDNGIGFEVEYQEKIFEVFQRLHGRQEYPGTGIGLSICRKIVQRHHGRISATATPNQGATFFVTLPTTGENT